MVRFPGNGGSAATALREQHRQTRGCTRGECSGRSKALKGGEPQERARLEHAGEFRSDGNRPGRTNGAGAPPPRVEARWHRPGSGFGPAVRQCVDPPGWVVLKGPPGQPQERSIERSARGRPARMRGGRVMTGKPVVVRTAQADGADGGGESPRVVRKTMGGMRVNQSMVTCGLPQGRHQGPTARADKVEGGAANPIAATAGA